MELVLDGLFVLLWVGSLVATFLPLLPATLLLWGAVLLHEALTGFQELSGADWGWVIGLGVLAMTLDNLAALLGARRYGAGCAGMWGAFLGGVAGAFLLPPWGIVLFPLLGAWLFEVLAGKSQSAAVRAAWGTLLGLLGGVLAKFLIHLAIGILVIRRIF
ncbi:DUF456 domain-containing protein [Marinithermus hydrothermalis]|uniref:DUF456 domain-containing protein n=1 Tax=Marinithermus hydrothermalis (strain DSM 14884 / JCM 11576 / T1) TaxID=869210 RepID=F2NLP6_MARHT|nr:DUF456 domain-containing protein [Marinithermus hydrothermalis]AEB10876.1 protein of unknown function DUF456 [Marinithermus hydrothermalis DSM 14884]